MELFEKDLEKAKGGISSNIEEKLEDNSELSLDELLDVKGGIPRKELQAEKEYLENLRRERESSLRGR